MKLWQQAIWDAIKISIWVSAVCLALVTLFFLLAGCSQFTKNKELEISCSAECIDCKAVKLKCGQDWETGESQEKQGNVAGPTIGQ